MSEAEFGFDLSEEALASDDANARYRGDNRLFVKFYNAPRKNEEKSVSMGRPIYDDTLYIRIQVPGDKESIVVRPARTMDKNRFRAQFERYQKGEEQVVDGTPLSEWPSINRSMVEELKHFGVYTVEQLVDMPDNQAQNFAGIQNLKNMARNFLERADGIAVDVKLEKALEDKNAQMEAMQAQIAEMQATIQKLSEADED